MNDQNPTTGASNATDFQPTTGNPQQNGGGSGVQPTADSVQPVQANGSANATQLYQQAERQTNLTVQTDSYSANSLVSVQPAKPRSNSGLVAVTGALVVLLLLVILMQRNWRAIPDSVAPLVDSDAETTTDTAEASLDTPATASKPVKKTGSKSKNKTPGRKKKRSSKKK